METENQVTQEAPLLEPQVDQPVEPVRQKKCDVEKTLHPNFVALMKASPTNPIVRGHLMKTFGQMPPDGLETFEMLKDWVEHNCEAKKEPKTKRASFEIIYDVVNEESGICRYSGKSRGTWCHSISLSQIQEWADDGLDIDEIVVKINEEASESCEPDDMELDKEDLSLIDFESNSSSGNDVSPCDDVEKRLRLFLIENCPELLDVIQ